MLLLGLLAALPMLVHPSAVWSACVFGDYSIPSEFERSVAVLVGTVVDERAGPASKNLYEGVIYSLRTDETLRGKLPVIVELFSENSSGRFPMAKGHKYILFLYQVEDRLAVDNCGNSGPLAEKENVLEVVRQLAKAANRSKKPN